MTVHQIDDNARRVSPGINTNNQLGRCIRPERTMAMNPYHPKGSQLIARINTRAIGNVGMVDFQAGDDIGVMDGCFTVHGPRTVSECFVSTRHEIHGVLLFRAHHTDEDKPLYRAEAAYRRDRSGSALTALVEFRNG